MSGSALSSSGAGGAGSLGPSCAIAEAAARASPSASALARRGRRRRIGRRSSRGAAGSGCRAFGGRPAALRGIDLALHLGALLAVVDEVALHLDALLTPHQPDAQEAAGDEDETAAHEEDVLVHLHPDPPLVV